MTALDQFWSPLYRQHTPHQPAHPRFSFIQEKFIRHLLVSRLVPVKEVQQEANVVPTFKGGSRVRGETDNSTCHVSAVTRHSQGD